MSNKLSKHAIQKVLNGEQLRAASVRVKIESIRENPWIGGVGHVAEVVFETVDDKENVISEMGRATVAAGNSVTIAEMDRAFTFTISS